MKKAVMFVVLMVAIGLVISPAIAFSPTVKPTLVAIDKKNKSVSFGGMVMAQKWEDYKMPLDQGDANYDPDHWHLIISATQVNPAVPRISMFVGWATDVEITDALVSLGAKTDKYPVETWTDRMKKDSPYPDMKAKGTKVTIYFTWKDGNKDKTVEANDIVENSTGKKLEFVFLGKQHPSHCIACMYSCVGGRVSNTALTTRDYMERGATWKLKKGVLPPDGTPVVITMKLG